MSADAVAGPGWDRLEFANFGTRYRPHAKAHALHPSSKQLLWVECVPPKDVLISSPPKPGNVALLGKRVVADVIKLSEVTLD